MIVQSIQRNERFVCQGEIGDLETLFVLTLQIWTEHLLRWTSCQLLQLSF